MGKITPFLWFDDKAEEAVNFYVSLFDNARIGSVSRYDDAVAEMAGMPVGSVMTVAFELDGQNFVALNGGPAFDFTEAVSFSIECADQEEIDYFWERLTEGGEESQCGWLKDKYGLSWQVVPTRLVELTNDPDPEKSRRVTQAMLQMKKINIAALEEAYNGENG